MIRKTIFAATLAATLSLGVACNPSLAVPIPEFNPTQSVLLSPEVESPINEYDVNASLGQLRSQGLEPYIVIVKEDQELRGFQSSVSPEKSLAENFFNKLISKWSADPEFDDNKYYIVSYVEELEDATKGSLYVQAGTYGRENGLSSRILSSPDGLVIPNLREYMPNQPTQALQAIFKDSAEYVEFTKAKKAFWDAFPGRVWVVIKVLTVAAGSLSAVYFIVRIVTDRIEDVELIRHTSQQIANRVFELESFQTSLDYRDDTDPLILESIVKFQDKATQFFDVYAGAREIDASFWRNYSKSDYGTLIETKHLMNEALDSMDRVLQVELMLSSFDRKYESDRIDSKIQSYPEYSEYFPKNWRSRVQNLEHTSEIRQEYMNIYSEVEQIARKIQRTLDQEAEVKAYNSNLRDWEDSLRHNREIAVTYQEKMKREYPLEVQYASVAEIPQVRSASNYEDLEGLRVDYREAERHYQDFKVQYLRLEELRKSMERKMKTYSRYSDHSWRFDDYPSLSAMSETMTTMESDYNRQKSDPYSSANSTWSSSTSTSLGGGDTWSSDSGDSLGGGGSW